MKYIILVMLLASVSCSAQNQPPLTPVAVDKAMAGDVLYRCSYKYDSKYNVEFLERNKADYHPPALPELLVYRITDTNGGKWSINQYDWKNYTCTSIVL